MSLYAECMKERYGCEVLEKSFGYITWIPRPASRTCEVFEFFVSAPDRGYSQNWRELWAALHEECRSRGLQRITGRVDIARPEPEKRVRFYMRNKGKLIGADDGFIAFEWEVE